MHGTGPAAVNLLSVGRRVSNDATSLTMRHVCVCVCVCCLATCTPAISAAALISALSLPCSRCSNGPEKRVRASFGSVAGLI